MKALITNMKAWMTTMKALITRNTTSSDLKQYRNFDGQLSVVCTHDRKGVFGILTVWYRSFAH